MYQVKIKSGGHINVLGENDKPVLGEKSLSEKEWILAQRLGRAFVDPEEKRDFWKVLLEKKEDPNYSLFQDFPEVIEEIRETTAKTVCQETIEMLRQSGAKTWREREAE